MTAWTPAQLDTIDGADELDVATRRADGTLRTARIVCVVRHNDQLYVRSVNGRDAAWYRGVQTRHAGHIAAGGIESDVTFADADHSLDDDLDAALVLCLVVALALILPGERGRQRRNARPAPATPALATAATAINT